MGADIGVHIGDSPLNPLAALVTVTVAAPADVTLRWSCGGRDGSAAKHIATADTLEIWGVRAETACTITVEVVGDDGSREVIDDLSWTSGRLPDDLPGFEATGGGEMSPGFTMISPKIRQDALTSYGFGVDEEGEIVWLYMDTRNPNLEFCVKQLSDGNLMILLEQGVRVITPGGRMISERYNMDMARSNHDMQPLPGGDVLMMVKDVRQMPVPWSGEILPVAGDRIVRLDPEGEIVWEWAAFDHLDPDRFPGPLSMSFNLFEEAIDWTHGNAVSLTPDGNSVLYSTRSQSWVVKISLESGEVEWILGDGGDFALDPVSSDGSAAGWFYNQHAPELLPDGTILIYDNGNERPGDAPRYSRAVRYALDEQAMTAAEIWSWASPLYTPGLGDMNLLPDGNYLIDAGLPERADAQVFEVSPDGDPVWTLTVARSFVYRAERLSWPGSPG